MSAKSVMLAPNELPSPDDLTYPLLASLKFDGRRCLVNPDGLWSRTMKPQSNKNLPAHLAALMEYSRDCGLVFDGELYSPDLTFNELESVFKSDDAPIPESVAFYCFDSMKADQWGACPDDFQTREGLTGMRIRTHTNELKHVKVVSQVPVFNAAEVRAKYEEALEAGFEGLILRSLEGKYKHGRATLREGTIFKQKPFDLLDAKVIGYEQQQGLKADIKRTKNELGRTARTFKQADYELVENMGALKVRDEKGREFSIGWGKGWTQAKRLDLWVRRDSLVGEWVEVRCMGVGEKDLPRMPQLIRFRESKE